MRVLLINYSSATPTRGGRIQIRVRPQVPVSSTNVLLQVLRVPTALHKQCFPRGAFALFWDQRKVKCYCNAILAAAIRRVFWYRQRSHPEYTRKIMWSYKAVYRRRKLSLVPGMCPSPTQSAHNTKFSLSHVPAFSDDFAVVLKASYMKPFIFIGWVCIKHLPVLLTSTVCQWHVGLMLKMHYAEKCSWPNKLCRFSLSFH